MNKGVAIVLALALMLPILAVTAFAEDTYDYRVTISPEPVQVGNPVTVIVSLTGYTADMDPIRGLQIDITGIDTNVLSVEEYTSLIEDTTALSNTASYNTASRRVRLFYAQMNGTLAAPCENVLKVVFRVNSGITEGGSITLPVTVKIQTLSGQQITLTSDFTIRYSTETSQVTNVDITWGAMEYEYTDGVWDTQTHSYAGGGWTDNGSGCVTVKNNGTSDVTAEFLYSTERSDVTGGFHDGTSTITGSVNVPFGGERTAYLILSGKPAEALSSTKIGTVTVRIGGN